MGEQLGLQSCLFHDLDLFSPLPRFGAPGASLCKPEGPQELVPALLCWLWGSDAGKLRPCWASAEGMWP